MAATQAHLAAALSNPAVMLQDVLHRAAFDGSLGQPMNVDPEMLEGVDNRALKEYIASVLKPGSAVLAAAGVSFHKSIAWNTMKQVTPPASRVHIAHNQNLFATQPVTVYRDCQAVWLIRSLRRLVLSWPGVICP